MTRRYVQYACRVCEAAGHVKLVSSSGFARTNHEVGGAHIAALRQLGREEDANRQQRLADVKKRNRASGIAQRRKA